MATHDVPRVTRPRTEAERLQELAKIENYRSLEDQFRQQVASTHFGLETLQITTKLLRLNPEYYTVWNARRRCLIVGPLSEPSDAPTDAQQAPSSSSTSAGEDPEPTSQNEPEPEPEPAKEVIRAELVFIVPLLMQHPKCYWIWNYRSWILQQAIAKLPFSDARSIWEEELALVGKMLHRDRRNYHAWAYRRHVVQTLESPSLRGQSMVEAEFQYTTRMIHMDLSNFSAWHNRSQLVCRLLDERSSSDSVRKQFLDDEFELVLNGLNVGPEDQSLWYYHQFLISNVLGQGDRPSIVPRLPVSERNACIAREIDAIKELLEDYDNVKWIYEVLVEYSLAARQLTETDQPKEKSQESRQAQVAQWLNKLRELDPMRNGRWDDLAQELALS